MTPRPSRSLLAALAIAAATLAAPASAVPVNTELQLLVDVSGSVDTPEFALQRDGYVTAFQNAAVQAELIANGGTAVRMIYWSGAAEQQVVGSGWTLINSIAAANAFAAVISSTPRPFSGQTAIGSALAFALPGFDTNGFEGRQVIDVSGDGASNDGIDTLTQRNAAAAKGVTINGLVILGEADLPTYYQNNVVTPGGFLRTAANFSTFGQAIQDKIIVEVRGVPEPGTYALLAVGLVMFGMVARRRVRTAA